MTKDQFFAAAHEAFGEEVTIMTSSDNLESWDSLSHLSLLTALDEITEGKAAELEELASARSIADIVRILEEAGLLSVTSLS